MKYSFFCWIWNLLLWQLEAICTWTGFDEFEVETQSQYFLCELLSKIDLLTFLCSKENGIKALISSKYIFWRWNEIATYRKDFNVNNPGYPTNKAPNKIKELFSWAECMSAPFFVIWKYYQVLPQIIIIFKAFPLRVLGIWRVKHK